MALVPIKSLSVSAPGSRGPRFSSLLEERPARGLATLLAAAVASFLAFASGVIGAPVLTVGLSVIGLAAIALAAWSLLSRLREQQHALEEAGRNAAIMAAENRELKSQIDQAHRRGAEINERSLRRIGADLHDGPAQLLGLILLKLDELPGQIGPSERSAPVRETVDLIRRAAAEALAEIRSTAHGLVLPDIQQVTLAATLELAARTHEQRTRTRVRTEIGPLPEHVPLPITISLFRFVQEALNNAFRHAGGRDQALAAGHDGVVITVEVSDQGPGFDSLRLEPSKDRLGLVGLNERLRSLGGSLEIRSAPGEGTRLIARFPSGVQIAKLALEHTRN